jgi:cytidine deaminase
MHSRLTDHEKQRLIAEAIRARLRAYAPYSQYRVGAALMGLSGTIYTGCNVENASYSATICAERAAVVKAVGEGEQVFRAISVVTPNGGYPCGTCRQVLFEFSPDMLVIIADAEGRVVGEASLTELLSNGFGPDKLEWAAAEG